VAAFRPNPYLAGFSSLFDVSTYSLDAFQSAISIPGFRIGLVNSLIVCVCAALFGLILYFALAYFSLRKRYPGGRYVAYLAMWPAAVPALVIGLGFLWTWVHVSFLYGTIAILVLAYITRFTPQGYQGVSSSLLQIHTELEESALVSGDGRVRTIMSVLAPLMRPGLVATFVLVFVLSMRELSVAIFLYTTQTQVLSITIFTQYAAGRFPPVAAMSLIYIVLLFVVAGIARRWFGLYSSTSESPR
jgi:iron(III) transport system permease protein